MSHPLNTQTFTTVRTAVLDHRPDGTPVYAPDGLVETLRALLDRGGKLRFRDWSSNASIPPPPNGTNRDINGPEAGWEHVYWDVLMP